MAGGLVALGLDEGREPEAAATATALEEPATPSVEVRSDAERIRSAAERVLPAVVTIVADLPETREADGTLRQTSNFGSGIVISPAGHVLTNFHVVEGAETLSIVLATGEQRPARLLGDDAPFADLAVLTVPAQGLRHAELGDSNGLRAGDAVLAVSGGAITGSNTVTTGVVSATGRAWPRNGVVLEDLVQTDAAVNSGDSGGALVDLDGRVVGLLTTVVRNTPSGSVVEGVAFAQSTNSLRAAVEAIMETGSAPRPRIGIERQSQHLEVTRAVAEQLGLPVPNGALVRAVAAGSPGERAGLQVGDLVVAVNGAGIDLERPLVNLLKAVTPGAEVELFVLRGEQQLVLRVTTSAE